MMPMCLEEEICSLKVEAGLSWPEIWNMTRPQGQMLIGYINRQREKAAQNA